MLFKRKKEMQTPPQGNGHSGYTAAEQHLYRGNRHWVLGTEKRSAAAVGGGTLA